MSLTEEDEDIPGTLKLGEYHPAAESAMMYVKSQLMGDSLGACILQEAFASSGLSGNRTAELCSETLRRILNGENVSDRYLLGLAWTMKEMEELRQEDPKKRKKNG